MNHSARVLIFLAHERQTTDWQAADAWRRLHARPDIEPLLSQPDHPGLRARVFARATILRQTLVRGA